MIFLSPNFAVVCFRCQTWFHYLQLKAFRRSRSNNLNLKKKKLFFNAKPTQATLDQETIQVYYNSGQWTPTAAIFSSCQTKRNHVFFFTTKTIKLGLRDKQGVFLLFSAKNVLVLRKVKVPKLFPQLFLKENSKYKKKAKCQNCSSWKI